MLELHFWSIDAAHQCAANALKYVKARNLFNLHSGWAWLRVKYRGLMKSGLAWGTHSHSLLKERNERERERKRGARTSIAARAACAKWVKNTEEGFVLFAALIFPHLFSSLLGFCPPFFLDFVCVSVYGLYNNRLFCVLIRTIWLITPLGYLARFRRVSLCEGHRCVVLLLW